MKNNFKFLAIIILLITVVLVISVEIKNRVETVSKGVGITNFNNIDSEVGPTLTDKQVEEAIEQNKETGGFHDFIAPEDLE